MKVYTEDAVYDIDMLEHRYRMVPKGHAANGLYNAWKPLVGFDIQRTLVIEYPDSDCFAKKMGLPCHSRHRIESSLITKVEQD